MNLLSQSAWLEAAFNWTWRASVASAILVLLVWLIDYSTRKHLPARASYLLWLCVFARLLLPTSPASNFSVWGLIPQIAQKDQIAHHSISTEKSLVPARTESPQISSTPKNNNTEISKTMVVKTSANVEAQISILLKWFWLAGVLANLTIIYVQHFKWLRYLRCLAPTKDERVLQALEQARAEMNVRCALQVLELSGEHPPALFGYFQPRLLLSKGTMNRLSDAELRLVFMHELAHVKRRDVLLNWIMIFAQAVHWFNPLAWFTIARLRAARETLCDSLVLQRANESEKTVYGATLIKLLAQVSPQAFTTSLVPLFGRKNEIQHRVTMIKNFKPITKKAVLATALLLALLTLFCFTNAAEKKPSAEAGTTAEAKPEPRKGSDTRLKILEEQLAQQNARIREVEDHIGILRNKLQITSDVSDEKSKSNSDKLQHLARLMTEARADFETLNSLYIQLKSLSENELQKALPTVTPDAQLAELLKELAAIQQKIAEMREVYSQDHPEVKRNLQLAKTIQSQIQERISGILHGLQIRADAQRQKMERLERELVNAREADIKKGSELQPYYDLQRKLEGLRSFRDKLQSRLEDEQLEALLK